MTLSRVCSLFTDSMALVGTVPMPPELWGEVFEYAFSSVAEAINCIPVSKAFCAMILYSTNRIYNTYKKNPFISKLYPEISYRKILDFVEFTAYDRYEDENLDIKHFEVFLKSSLCLENKPYLFDNSLTVLNNMMLIDSMEAPEASDHVKSEAKNILDAQPLFFTISDHKGLKGKFLDEILIELMCGHIRDIRIIRMALFRYNKMRLFNFYFFHLYSFIDKMELSQPEYLKRKLFKGRLWFLMYVQGVAFVYTLLASSYIAGFLFDNDSNFDFLLFLKSFLLCWQPVFVIIFICLNLIRLN